jgi:hypothetical protein
MRIKLTLKDPFAVSPILRYDKLVVHFKDVRSLFVETKERRLQGSPNIVQSTMKSGIQKQMSDNSLGREVIRSVYIVRSLLMLAFMIFLVISWVLHAPFDRMILMLLDLQLMSYLCLLHVTIPGNVVIAS